MVRVVVFREKDRGNDQQGPVVRYERVGPRTRRLGGPSGRTQHGIHHRLHIVAYIAAGAHLANAVYRPSCGGLSGVCGDDGALTMFSGTRQCVWAFLGYWRCCERDL